MQGRASAAPGPAGESVSCRNAGEIHAASPQYGLGQSTDAAPVAGHAMIGTRASARHSGGCVGDVKQSVRGTAGPAKESRIRVVCDLVADLDAVQAAVALAKVHCNPPVFIAPPVSPAGHVHAENVPDVVI